MITAITISEVRELTKSWRKQGLSVGLVPTMGYLHAGHRSLIAKARSENNKVVVSIFVNPIQFGPNEDCDRYPRDLEHDCQICRDAGADLVFAPSVAEMYPVKNLAYVDLDILGDGLCGAKRPGHFRGVCTVVTKLFNIVQPQRAYFGAKDAQQLTIIQRMTEDLSFDIRIVACPTVREPDGLALSSRNSYLSPAERKAALIIAKSLALARAALENGEKDAAAVKKIIAATLAQEPLAIVDYIDVVDAAALKPLTLIDQPALVAVAVFIGKTRLIDNFFHQEGSSC